MSSSRKTLLAATVPENVQQLKAIYSGRYDLEVVTRMDEALAALERDVGLILCNVLFDDGALYDLLRAAKAHPLACTAPFFVIDGSRSLSSPAIRQSIDIASKALGADQVIHMAEWHAALGHEEAIAKLIAMVREHIGRMHAPLPDEHGSAE